MTAVYVIAALTANGCRLIPDGKKLRVQDPYGVLTDELRDLLRKHKSDILSSIMYRSTYQLHCHDTPDA